MNKNISKIIEELVDMGYSERKILNRLKEIKESLVKEESDIELSIDKAEEKRYNKLINGLLFGNSFYIEQPSTQLLGLVKNVKKVYGSEFCYYLLYNILSEKYFNNQTHSKTDCEKCNWLMYLIKENNEKYYNDFIESSKNCKEPF